MASEMDKVKYDGNIMEKVEELLRRVSALERRGVNLERLDELTDDLGEVRSGRFLAMSAGYEPTDTDASGVFMSAAGETFGEDTYNIGGVDNGGLQFGLRSTDGVGVFSGGDATIGADGIEISKMGYLIQHTATDGTTERTGSMGMWAEPGGTEPCYGLAFNAPGGAELVTNGDAETGDFTGWTKTTETRGAWSVVTGSYAYDGTYAFMFDYTSLGGATGVLTSGACSVTSNVGYLFTCNVLKYGLTSSAQVKWYDSGSSLLRTDSISLNQANNNYLTTSELLVSPSGANTATITLTVTGSTQSAVFDSISLKAVSVASNLYFDSTGELCLNGSPALPKHCYISTIAMTSSATLTNYSANPAYKYTTAANARNGDTFALTVPPLAAGTYSIYFCGNKHNVRGKVDWTLDGTSIVTGQDWYASGATEYTFQVDSVSVTSGAHTLAGTINGKNASSSDYSLALYSVVFVKTA